MKRFVAILLILVFVFALSATAFAASNVTSPEKRSFRHAPIRRSAYRNEFGFHH